MCATGRNVGCTKGSAAGTPNAAAAAAAENRANGTRPAIRERAKEATRPEAGTRDRCDEGARREILTKPRCVVRHFVRDSRARAPACVVVVRVVVVSSSSSKFSRECTLHDAS